MTELHKLKANSLFCRIDKSNQYLTKPFDNSKWLSTCTSMILQVCTIHIQLPFKGIACLYKLTSINHSRFLYKSINLWLEHATSVGVHLHLKFSLFSKYLMLAKGINWNMAHFSTVITTTSLH